jgi:hypothetical protein
MGSAFRRRFFADADGGIASGAIDDPQQLAVLFEAWNARVKEDVPSDKLLVFSAKDGWGPLCAFLGVPVPSEPFPNVNDVDAFKLKDQAGLVARRRHRRRRAPRHRVCALSCWGRGRSATGELEWASAGADLVPRSARVQWPLDSRAAHQLRESSVHTAVRTHAAGGRTQPPALLGQTGQTRGTLECAICICARHTCE